MGDDDGDRDLSRVATSIPPSWERRLDRQFGADLPTSMQLRLAIEDGLRSRERSDTAAQVDQIERNTEQMTEAIGSIVEQLEAGTVRVEVEDERVVECEVDRNDD